MPTIDKSLEALAKRSTEAAGLAKAQRENADKQHAVARKTEVLCDSLAADVASLKEELAEPVEEMLIDKPKPAKASL